MHRKMLGARQRVLGPEHPDTLASMNNLANTLHAQGKRCCAAALSHSAGQVVVRLFLTTCMCRQGCLARVDWIDPSQLQCSFPTLVGLVHAKYLVH